MFRPLGTFSIKPFNVIYAFIGCCGDTYLFKISNINDRISSSSSLLAFLTRMCIKTYLKTTTKILGKTSETEKSEVLQKLHSVDEVARELFSILSEFLLHRTFLDDCSFFETVSNILINLPKAKKFKYFICITYCIFVVTQLTSERSFESNWYSSCSIYCVNNLSKLYCIILCDQILCLLVLMGWWVFEKNCLLKMLDL